MPLQIHLKFSKWLLLLPVCVLAAVLTGCILYCTTGYETLRDWYPNLHPCIYNVEEWPVKFFTPAVKQSGNAYCIAGICLSACLLIFLIRKLRKAAAVRTLSVVLEKRDALFIGGLYVFGLIIWLYGFLETYPAYDEVFSAINCAGTHPFQAASYYMLPNNHVFFNLLNATAFFFASDKVISGRILSGIAFAALIPLLYYWLKSKTQSRPYAAVFCAVMMLQFPVWVFASQARGYSVFLLCAWTAIISLQQFFKTGSRTSLLFHGVATVIGFWTVPTYVLWEMALIIYSLVHMIRVRRISWLLIQTHLISACAVFIAYLPLLAFSGSASILENRYVKAATLISFSDFLPYLRMAYLGAIQYCFSGSVFEEHLIYTVLFALPLVLLPFVRKTSAGTITAFYVLAWLVVCGMAIQTQRFPFNRNQIAHCSITLAALLLCCFEIVKKILTGRRKVLQPIILGLGLLALSVHFIRFNMEHLHDFVYFSDSRSRYIKMQAALDELPSGSRIGLSNEGFYWEFLCRKRGLAASPCMKENIQFYIKIEGEEQVPVSLSGHVEKWKQVDEYEIYRVGN